jgi:hypothetical protein
VARVAKGNLPPAFDLLEPLPSVFVYSSAKKQIFSLPHELL